MTKIRENCNEDYNSGWTRIRSMEDLFSIKWFLKDLILRIE